MGQPLLRGDRGGADVLGARVVLVDDRAPPLDHLALDRDRARRGRVDHVLQARDVVALALLLRELQHADEHRRDELRVRHSIALDELEALARVEALHHHDRRAQSLHRHRRHQRRGVIQRRGRQVHGVGAGAVEGETVRELHGRGRRVAERRAGQLFAYTLWAARRARRIQHLPALALVVERAGRRAGEQVVVALEAFDVTDGRDPYRHARQVEVADDIRDRLGRDQGDRAAVVEDVLHLCRTQVLVDRGVVKPRPLRGPRDLQERPVVLHHDRDVVADAEAAGAQHTRQASGPVLELRVRGRLTASAHDDRGRVRRLLRVPRRCHRRTSHGTSSPMRTSCAIFAHHLRITPGRPRSLRRRRWRFRWTSCAIRGRCRSGPPCPSGAASPPHRSRGPG